MDLIPFFETAIAALNKSKSAELGDRTQYIGSSDVGSCARKVYLQKQDPSEPDFNTMMRFSRGHVAEILLDNMFTAAGVKHLYDTQVEVVHPDHPLKAHIDFLFYADFDGKPPRNNRIRRNRFKPSYTRWLFPAIVALLSLAIVIGIR